MFVFDTRGHTIHSADCLVVKIKDREEKLLGSASVAIKELSSPGTTVAHYTVPLNAEDGTQTTVSVDEISPNLTQH